MQLDRVCFAASSLLGEPFAKTWEIVRYRLATPLDSAKFQNCSSEIREIGIRAMICLGSCFGSFAAYLHPVPFSLTTATLFAGGKILRAVAMQLQKNGFTHVRGKAQEKRIDKDLKVMTWNICAIFAGMSLDHGGVVDWRLRIDQIVNLIKKEDPDVLVLQEVYDPLVNEVLVRRLQNHYAHFFIQMGPALWGNQGGLTVLSKCAVHNFSHTSFANNDWTLNRGFVSLEVKKNPTDTAPCNRIIGTHLIHNSENNRAVQVAQIVNHLAKKTLRLPTLLVGDLNIERDQPQGAYLKKLMHHGYLGSQATCTNRLKQQWTKKTEEPDEMIDYISLFKGPGINPKKLIKECRLIRAHSTTFNTRTALSDHHALVMKLAVAK